MAPVVLKVVGSLVYGTYMSMSTGSMKALELPVS